MRRTSCWTRVLTALNRVFGGRVNRSDQLAKMLELGQRLEGLCVASALQQAELANLAASLRRPQLVVESLSIVNEKGRVVCHLAADQDGDGSLMITDQHGLVGLSITMDAGGGQLTVRGPGGEPLASLAGCWGRGQLALLDIDKPAVMKVIGPESESV